MSGAWNRELVDEAQDNRYGYKDLLRTSEMEEHVDPNRKIGALEAKENANAFTRVETRKKFGEIEAPLPQPKKAEQLKYDAIQQAAPEERGPRARAFDNFAPLQAAKEEQKEKKQYEELTRTEMQKEAYRSRERERTKIATPSHFETDLEPFNQGKKYEQRTARTDSFIPVHRGIEEPLEEDRYREDVREHRGLQLEAKAPLPIPELKFAEDRRIKAKPIADIKKEQSAVPRRPEALVAIPDPRATVKAKVVYDQPLHELPVEKKGFGMLEQMKMEFSRPRVEPIVPHGSQPEEPWYIKLKHEVMGTAGTTGERVEVLPKHAPPPKTPPLFLVCLCLLPGMTIES
jgi:hypothetical protein